MNKLRLEIFMKRMHMYYACMLHVAQTTIIYYIHL